MLATLVLLCLLSGCVAPSLVMPPAMSDIRPQDVLQEFVSSVVGNQDVPVFWLLNNMIEEDPYGVYDITININGKLVRFIVSMKHKKIVETKNIEPEAEVNCQEEHESLKNGID